MELGLDIKDLEELTEGMIFDIIDEKMIDTAEYDEDIYLINNNASLDDFFPIS